MERYSYGDVLGLEKEFRKNMQVNLARVLQAHLAKALSLQEGEAGGVPKEWLSGFLEKNPSWFQRSRTFQEAHGLTIGPSHGRSPHSFFLVR